MDLQFYPTPPDLAARAWSKFKDRDFSLVLEPSAGRGDLARARPSSYHHHRGAPKVQCIEVDVRHHAQLREDFDVIGLDFLQYAGGAMFSHIIMNPPFAEGARHVLKAWEILWDGEIVAIVNAETVRNACTRERQHLVNLILQHGTVEYIEGAFEVQEAERKTAVDVALIHLRKEADTTDEIVGDLIDSLRDDRAADGLDDGFDDARELALPASEISNLVRAFNAAVQTMRQSIFSQARHAYYTSLLGRTLAARRGDLGACADDPHGREWVRSALNKEYSELKDRGWAAVLHSSAVLSKLSSSGQKLVESQFEQIKRLEFTEPNIRGFLVGLCENQGQIQLEMACAVFDTITRYYTDNAVHYRGWKSNDKHRTCGRRIKALRFVLPHHSTESYSSSFRWETERLLADFDKVFAMLDGKSQPQQPLVQVCKEHFKALRAGDRVSSSYFDVRHYPGAGTIHFFARDKKLVDRLNRVVGQHRQWLPPEGAKVPDAFWLQYDSAERLDKEVTEQLRKDMGARGRWWDDPRRELSVLDEDRQALAQRRMDAALAAVQERHNIRLGDRIENDTDDAGQLLLAA